MDQATAARIERIAAFPDWVAARESRFAPDLRNWKPEGAEFCWTEQVCHLRDVEREGYCVRIGRMLEEDNPALLGVDGARLAVERRYTAQDPSRALGTFRFFRGQSVAALRSASPQQLQRLGHYDAAQTFSLLQLIDAMLEHDADHRGQIEALIAASATA